MLNKLPNVRLSGENYNILYEASKLSSYFDSENHSRNFVHEKTKDEGVFMHKAITEGPFEHNAMPLGSMACVTQTLLRTINPPNLTDESSLYDPVEEANRIIGAKLIRLHQGNWQAWQAAKFFRENFPCAKFVVNIRSNEENQVQSLVNNFHWKEEQEEQKIKGLEHGTQFLRKFHRWMGDESSRLIDMSEWKDDVGIINDLLDWLGFENCAFKNLIHENHDGYERDTTTKVHLGKKCRLST